MEFESCSTLLIPFGYLLASVPYYFLSNAKAADRCVLMLGFSTTLAGLVSHLVSVLDTQADAERAIACLIFSRAIVAVVTGIMIAQTLNFGDQLTRNEVRALG
jgi:hypothetical protein